MESISNKDIPPPSPVRPMDGSNGRRVVTCIHAHACVVLLAVAVVCHAAPEYYPPPAEHAWMLTPLISVKVTPEEARIPPPYPVRPMEVVGGGWSREYMCMHVWCWWQWQWSVVLPLYILPPAEHEWMLTPLIVVKVTSYMALSPPPCTVRPIEVVR